MDAVQDGIERFGNVMKISQGQFAIVQLPIGEYAVDEFLDEPLQPGGCRVGQDTGGGFDHIGKHDQPGFTRLGLGAGIAIIIDIDGIFAFELFGFVIEVLNQAGAMMLTDGVGDVLSQLIPVRHVHAVFDVRDQDKSGHGRGQFIVPVATAALVFDKVGRFADFPDIVIIAADLCEKGVCADFSCCGLDHIPDDNGMMIGSRGFDHELAHEGLVEVGKLQQFDVGCILEKNFDNWY